MAIQLNPGDWLAATPLYLGIGVCLAFLIALPAALLYRRLRRAQLRTALRACSSRERREVLLPLRDDRSADVRAIVGPLVHHFHVDSELAPAPAPAGKGSEPSADSGP